MNHPFGPSWYRAFMRFDAFVSDGAFSLGQWLKRCLHAYADWTWRFRLRGARRLFFSLADSTLTIIMAFGMGLLMFALPPFDGEGNVWNLKRLHAVTFTDAEGHAIGKRGIRQDDQIPLSEIPPVVINAVLATEDARFYQHFGVDFIGTARALVENARDSEVRQGGSTITQQLAKNLFLSPERTLRRKINEVFLAFWIEARLSKDEILKLYLDRSYLGGGNYGVEAASQFYFGKSVRDVGLPEAAILAGLFKAPTRYAPHVNIAAARDRAAVVLQRMVDAHFITPGEAALARREPAAIVPAPEFASPDWYLDYAYQEVLKILADNPGISADYVIEVKTTIDPALQSQAQTTISEMLEKEGPPYRAGQAALVSITPDGALKAMVGGRSYAESQFNRATDSWRQPGSSFKPFVYLAALLNGYTPQSPVVDAPITINGWTARNYKGSYAGRTDLTTALAQSYNTVPLHLMRAIGRKPIIDTAYAAGIETHLLAVPSMPLGANALTLSEMASAYATFASGGIRNPMHAVLEIRKADGSLLWKRPASDGKRVFPEEKIAELNQMLAAVVKRGTGRRADIGFEPQAGKTGTTSDYRDAWFVGYTGQLVTGIWFGNDDYSEMEKMTGGTLPALAWQRIMSAALASAEPMALAGLPVDESYSRIAADVPAGNQPRQTASLAPAEAQPQQKPPATHAAPRQPVALPVVPVPVAPSADVPPVSVPQASPNEPQSVMRSLFGEVLKVKKPVKKFSNWLDSLRQEIEQ